MLSIFVGIQTVCIGVSSYLTYKSMKKSTKLTKVKGEGFKYYKAGGF